MKRNEIIIGQEYWCSLWFRDKFRPRQKKIIGIKRTIPFAETDTGEYVNLENVFATFKQSEMDCGKKNANLIFFKNDVQENK